MAILQELIDFGIITAPRQLPTLAYSVQSLRKVIDCYLTVFAEPGRHCIEGHSINLLVNSERLGALKNYDHALRWMLKHGKKPYICILEDDYLYNKSLVDRLHEIVAHEGEFGYYNLFTNANNPLLKTMNEKGWHKMDLGWHDAWGVAYVFQRLTVEKLTAHLTYKGYFEKTDRNIDAVVSETLKQLGLPMFYHNPSPACSFGIVSTLGHACQTDGLNFKLD
jgi:hypothetical protein